MLDRSRFRNPVGFVLKALGATMGLAPDLARWTDCADSGTYRLMVPRVNLPAYPTRRTREQIVRALRRQPNAQAVLWDATLPESYLEAEHAGGFGDRPLLVLTRGNAQLPAHPTVEDRGEPGGRLFSAKRTWR